MSMLDVFFSKGAFRGAKCKTLLNLTIPRIKLLRNRREIHLKQMKRDIAKLLEGGQEATARIRVEHIIREENTMAAQEILELFCELIVVRLPIIEAQRECPLDLKEAISSLCFAAPRCADLPELQQVQMLFAAKYGKEFVAAATELMPDCGVNRQIIELLSVRAPSAEVKVKLLKEIAAEHEVEWDPAASETEFLKPHEDLLNGPTYLVAHATTEFSKEENVAPLTPVEASDEHPGSDCETSLDLPEVPRASVRPNTSTAFSPDLGPVILPLDVGSEIEGRNSGTAEETPNLDIETKVESKALGVVSDHPAVSVSAGGSQQFVPFVASPPSSATFPASQSERLPAFDPSPSVLAGTSPSPTISAARNEKVPSVPESDASLSRSRSGVDVDLQDVLAAAQAAAETAERAAAAARSAASLAQVRITELTTKNRKLFEKGTEDPASDNNDSRKTNQVKDSFLAEEKKLNHLGDGEPTLPTAPSPDVPSTEDKSPSYVGHGSAYQPQRSTSLEDDPYYSYPNLFSRQNSTIPSPTGDSPSPH